MSSLGFRFTWHGHANIEVETPGGLIIRVDPWFGNPRSTVPVADVDRCDVMLVTHGHADHLGGSARTGTPDSVAIAARTRPAWPAIHELALWLRAHAQTPAEVIGMNKGGTVVARGLAVTMVRAEHSAGQWDEASGDISLGEPAGFVIALENGMRIYHAGDTDVFGDMALIAELHRPDVAFLPIGGHYTMDPAGAAKAVELLRVRTVVPIHYGTFPLLTGTPAQLRDALAARGLGSVVVVAPEPGVPVG
jgi:hypothetical protein